MDLFVTQLSIGNSVLPADTTAFDALGKKERDYFMTRASEMLAAELYAQDRYARQESADRAEMLAARKANELAAVAARTEYLSGLNLNTLEGRIRFFIAIGGHVALLNEHGQSTGANFNSVDIVLQNAKQRKYSGAITVQLEKTAAVCVIGDPSALGLPETTKAVMNGITYFFYASQSRTPSLAFNSPGLSFRWLFDVLPDDKFSAPVIDPATGTVPAVGPKIDRYLRDCHTKPDLFFELIRV